VSKQFKYIKSPPLLLVFFDNNISMKITFLLLFFSITMFSQDKLDVKFYYEKVPNGFEIMVDNNEYCDVTAILKLKHENVTVSSRNKNTFLIPARKKHLKLSELMAIKIGRYAFEFTHREYRGDIKKTSYSKYYPYSLPFLKGQSYLLSQGYDGKFNHKGIDALDFEMPIGTAITAIRSGIVIKVVDKFDKHGDTEDFARFANYIIIMHSDGTFALYKHLKHKSAIVKAGDKIMRGKVIALSGNTGWVNTPQLHLEVYKPRPLAKQYIKTEFKVGTGHSPVLLKAKKTYSRNY
jgi:murein DD-endopeptidase MepM/ murein hydrolase activator NlpD